jgi:DNA-binding CsgD family transcriptional regulator
VAIVSRSVPAAEPALKCLNAGFSEEWIGEYSRNGYFACDATKRPEHAASGFVAWSAALGRPANDAERKYARRARECGVSAGVTVGVDEPHGPQTWFAFIGRAVERGDREAILLRHLTPYLHESMCRAAAARPAQDDQDRATLTPREREVLCWAMSGKTNWEISVILRVSERTVKFHLRNVMVKLDVSTRAHAVAVALSRGLIMFAE